MRGEVHRDRFVGGQDLTRWSTRAGRALAGAVHRLSSILGPHSALILTLL
ncbi:MAG: superfamily domain protein, partial [Arthrobacter sp.]|nr:superfamily domain protein [Arthrobacter sp.]